MGMAWEQEEYVNGRLSVQKVDVRLGVHADSVG